MPGKIVLLALTVACVATFALPAFAELSACEQRIIKSWETERNQCETTLSAQLSTIKLDLQGCVNVSEELPALALCIRSANTEAKSRNVEFRTCLAQVNTFAYNAIRDCPSQQSN